MQLLPENLNFDFMAKRRIAVAFSMLLILSSLVSLAVLRLSFGIDFTGGTVIELGFKEPVELTGIRTKLTDSELGGAVVQHFGSPRDVLIRIAPKDGRSGNRISERVLEMMPEAEMRRVEFVGPQVGEELTEQGGLAMLYALIGILIYVSLRFQRWFALGAVVALVHDVIIVLGIFSVIGIEFDLPVLAAILAVIGYSLNDTIVVFDRMRENFRKMRSAAPIDVMNASLNQTLARTVMTSLTTLLVLIALFFLGGELIHAFATALIIGVVVGSYSSMYVASTTALALGVKRADLMPTPKEDADLGSLP